MTIADWHGVQVPIDQMILSAAGAQGYINRRYTHSGGLDCVFFYVACGTKARDLMPHRPEICYVGSGWTLEDRRSIELSLDEETVLPCSVLEFSRGLLQPERIVVLHYYIVDGTYSHDVSLLRSIVWRSSTVRQVMQIQIGTSITESITGESARRTVCDFARDSAPFISDLFQMAQEDEDACSQGSMDREQLQ